MRREGVRLLLLGLGVRPYREKRRQSVCKEKWWGHVPSDDDEHEPHRGGQLERTSNKKHKQKRAEPFLPACFSSLAAAARRRGGRRGR